MPISEAAHELLDALDFRDRNALARLFAADFRCSGTVSALLGRGRALAVLDICAAAFSDFSFNFTEAREQAGVLRLRYALSGTHDGPLDLYPLGIPLQLPPTGTILRLPVSAATVTFNSSGEVSNLFLQVAAGAGPGDMITRLGGTLPPVPSG